MVILNELCRYNDILNLVDLMPDIESGLFNLSYPLTFDPQTFEQYNLPASLGGLTVSDLGTVSSAAALSLTFFLDVTEDWQTTVGCANTNSPRSKLFHSKYCLQVGDGWERQFLATLEKSGTRLPDLALTRFVSSTPAWEMEKAKDSITPNLLVNVAIMVSRSF